MKQNMSLIISNDLALCLSGENNSHELLRKFIKKLLFHSSFSTGLFFKASKNGDYFIYDVIGNRRLCSYTGVNVSLPTEFMTTAPHFLNNPDLSFFHEGLLNFE